MTRGFAGRGAPAAATCATLLVVLLTAGPPLHAQVSLDRVVQQVRQGGCSDAVPVLEQLSSGADLEAQRAAYLTGWCLGRMDRHAAAIAAFRSAAGHPSLRMHAQVQQAIALLRSGDASEATTLLRAAAVASPARLRARALSALGEAEVALKHPAQAVAALQTAADLRPDDPAVWLQLGSAAAAAGRGDVARRAYARAAWAFPGDPREAQARVTLSNILGRPVRAADIDAESRVLRAKRLAQSGVWDQAEAELRAVTTSVRSGPLAGETWYRLGEIALYSDLRTAHEAFRRAADLGWNIDGAWFWTASTARRLGLASQAREAMAALMRVAPAGLWTARYWFGAGLTAESDGRTADAATAYRRASDAAPVSDEGAEARWRLGWIALRAARYGDAETRFRTAAQAADASSWRGEAARAWYWTAKTIEARTGRSGEGEAAAIVRMVAERYPLTFYGQRARARVGSPVPILPSSPPHVLPRDAAAPAYEELAWLGMDADAADAAEDALGEGVKAGSGAQGSRNPRIVRFLAEIYGRLGDFPRSAAYAEEALAAGVRDDMTWRLAYPKAYWTDVTAAAQSANIDPLLLLALVREESRYDAAVISPARAVGLAQLLPSTAQAMTNDASIGLQQLKDPALNLRLGARYVRMQLDRFGGDERLALAAYNAGPGAARRWVGLDPDPDYFLERIPYTETRAYVRRVLGSYGVYKLIW